ncbi:MAG: SPFH domain-containing protein [Clostridia bacterium]|nr:SPFH domain-containing protein [Clostridia bacterium]
MGLFNRMKKQLMEVIEWNDSSKDTIVYKFPLTEREEIMNSSSLVVRPGQVALFVHKGQIADVFSAGTYKLATENIPFLTKLLSLPTGFNSRIKADVYYVNIKQFVGQKWGTQNPVMMRDADFGNVRIRAYGVFGFKVDDPKTFMEEVFGTNEVYKVDDVLSQLKAILVQGISDSIAESKLSVLDLAANYKEFSKHIMECSQKEFNNLGLKITSMVVENISLPEAVEQALDERTKLGVMEDKTGTFTQYQAAQAMRDAAQNPSGGNFAGMGIGLGAGVAMGQNFSEALATENKPRQATKVCKHCGTKLKQGTKFCSECGSKQTENCPKCGAVIGDKDKFCPDCGQALFPTCPKCGAELKKNTKFCPECGERVLETAFETLSKAKEQKVLNKKGMIESELGDINPNSALGKKIIESMDDKKRK